MDLEVWKVYNPIEITGTLYNPREVSVQWTFAMATPVHPSLRHSLWSQLTAVCRLCLFCPFTYASNSPSLCSSRSAVRTCKRDQSTPLTNDRDRLAGRRGTRRVAEKQHARLERGEAGVEVSDQDTLSGGAAAMGDWHAGSEGGSSSFRRGRGSVYVSAVYMHGKLFVIFLVGNIFAPGADAGKLGPRGCSNAMKYYFFPFWFVLAWGDTWPRGFALHWTCYGELTGCHIKVPATRWEIMTYGQCQTMSNTTNLCASPRPCLSYARSFLCDEPEFSCRPLYLPFLLPTHFAVHSRTSRCSCGRIQWCSQRRSARYGHIEIWYCRQSLGSRICHDALHSQPRRVRISSAVRFWAGGCRGGGWRGHGRRRTHARSGKHGRACHADGSTRGLSTPPKQRAWIPRGRGTTTGVGLRGARAGNTRRGRSHADLAYHL